MYFDLSIQSIAQQRGQGSRKSSSLIKSLGGKTTDRAALASYIRLFESVVIRALKHYTTSSDAEQQSQVLELLIQLVQLRVNYCLLDSDQVFIGYVIKQIEFVENGEVANANMVVPNIFRYVGADCEDTGGF
jgi:huntingtin